MNYITKIAAAAALSLFAGAASAATLDVSSETSIGTVTCGSCSWLDNTGGDYNFDDGAPTAGSGFWDPADATVTLYNIDPNANSIVNEVNHLNHLTGGTYDYTTFTKDESGILSSYTSTYDEILILKFGQGLTPSDGTHLFVWNDAGSTISYSGRGLSHVTTGVVPLPAAGLLLLGSLGGLAVMRRQKKA